MLSVLETVVETVQDRVFKFVFKNKKDKVKRAVIYQPFSHGGVNCPNVHTVVKSLRLSWSGKLFLIVILINMEDYNPPINFRVILLATLRHVV